MLDCEKVACDKQLGEEQRGRGEGQHISLAETTASLQPKWDPVGFNFHGQSHLHVLASWPLVP